MKKSDKTDMLLRHVAQPAGPQYPLIWSMADFESFVVSVLGGAANAFKLEGSNDLVQWAPLPVENLSTLGTQPVTTFNPGASPLIFAGNKTARFVRLNRSTIDGTAITLVTVQLNRSAYIPALKFTKAYV